jgi:hypothetical protein
MGTQYRNKDAKRFASPFETLRTIRLAAILTLIVANPVLGQTPAPPLRANEGATRVSNDVSKDATKAETKVDPAEVLKVVNALEERVRELEAKLAKAEAAAAVNAASAATTSAAATTSVAAAKPVADDITDIKKEIAAIHEDSKKNQGFTGFFRDVEVSGLVDGYYSYNFNRPDGGINTGRAFDIRDNNFSLNLAKITLGKNADSSSPVGFKLDLGFGQTIDITNGPNPTGGDAARNILQAYATYLAPIGKGLTVDFGKFTTPAGSEVIETKDNYNYSRSYLFGLGPYYHTGFRAKYAFNGKVAVTGLLINGWDSVVDNNTGKTVGISVGITPTSRFSWTQTYLGGAEQALDNRPKRHFSDTVVSFVATDKLTFLANYAYGADQFVSGQKGHWQGLAAYFKYAFDKHFAFSPRFEVFDDNDGFRTGTRQTLKGLTFTQEIKFVDNLITRIEYRRDWSSADYFSKSYGRLVRGQNTLLIGISYYITSRGQ